MLVITVIVVMNHKNYAPLANNIRQELATKVVDEVLYEQPEVRDAVIGDIQAKLKPVYYDIVEGAAMPPAASTTLKLVAVPKSTTARGPP